MALEDELASIMREHDGEAPRAAELPDRPWAGSSRRRRFLLPAAAAAAVVLIAGGAVTFARHGGSGGAVSDRGPGPTTAAVATVCPARYTGLDGESTQPIVPAKPAGIDTGGRLVPNRTPSSVLICAYTGAPPRDGHLSRGPQTVRQRVLTTELDNVRAALTDLPPVTRNYPCGGVGLPSDDSAALVRLTYAGGGIVWVAAPGRDCTTSSNGVLDVADVFGSATSALRTGRWPESGSGSAGRFGQQTSMAPSGATGAVVGRQANVTSSALTRTVPAASLRTLVAELNSSPVRVTTHECHGDGRTIQFVISLSYPSGPGVDIRVDPSCRPAVDNGSLQSAAAPELLSLLERLTR